MSRAPSRITPKTFAGTWRITETEVWDQDALDTVQPAFIKFDDECIGSLGMIVIGAGLDCRFGSRDGKALVEFTFEGDDDGHPCSGRGFGAVDADAKLRGRLFIHLGDDSEFLAERSDVGAERAPSVVRPRTRPRRRRRALSIREPLRPALGSEPASPERRAGPIAAR
jgi:hypothetical protein